MLYGAIGRLKSVVAQAGWCSDRKRPYRSTAAGAEALQITLGELRAIVEAGTSGLAGLPSIVERPA